jgi:hypothetical protein
MKNIDCLIKPRKTTLTSRTRRCSKWFYSVEALWV